MDREWSLSRQQTIESGTRVAKPGWVRLNLSYILDDAKADMMIDAIDRLCGEPAHYTLNVANNAPNADNAYTLINALLASSQVGAEMTRASGFISTYSGVNEHLNELEQRATSFTEEELAGMQFFRAEANELKYSLVDPAVEAVKAA